MGRCSVERGAEAIAVGVGDLGERADQTFDEARCVLFLGGLVDRAVDGLLGAGVAEAVGEPLGDGGVGGARALERGAEHRLDRLDRDLAADLIDGGAELRGRRRAGDAEPIGVERIAEEEGAVPGDAHRVDDAFDGAENDEGSS